MLTRRRFIEMTAATTVAGAGIGLGQDALAATSGTVWSSATWKALHGKRLTIIDSTGTSQTVRIGATTVSPRQAHTKGEAFTVVLAGASGRIRDGLYRLRGGVSGQVLLTEGASGAAILTVNSVCLAS